MENDVVQDLVKKFLEIKIKHPKLYNSGHEAIGVILEEFQELQNEVFKKEPDLEKVYLEALDLATSSFAFAVFLDKQRK